MFDGAFLKVTDRYGYGDSYFGSNITNDGDNFIINQNCNLVDESGNYAGAFADQDNVYDPQFVGFDTDPGTLSLLTCSIDATSHLLCTGPHGNVFSVSTGDDNFSATEPGVPGSLNLGSKVASPGALVHPLVVPSLD